MIGHAAGRTADPDLHQDPELLHLAGSVEDTPDEALVLLDTRGGKSTPVVEVPDPLTRRTNLIKLKVFYYRKFQVEQFGYCLLDYYSLQIFCLKPIIACVFFDKTKVIYERLEGQLCLI